MGKRAEKCQFRHEGLPDDYQCTHLAEFEQPGIGKVCVFHWDPQDDAEKHTKVRCFNTKFEIFFEKPEEKNLLDCRGFVFPARFSFLGHKEVPDKTTFEYASFGERTVFQNTTFGEGVSFREVTFGDRTRFREATFRGSVNFTGATALGSLSFAGRDKNHVFEGGLDVPVDFQRVRFERPELIQFSTVNLQGVSFLNTDVSQANFVDVTWPGNISFSGRIHYDTKDRLYFRRPHDTTDLKWLELQCQQLKFNYENKRNHADAGDFHWAEMEYRRRRHWYIAKGDYPRPDWPGEKKRPSFLDRWSSFWSAIGLWLYKEYSGYGERIGLSLRILLWSLFTVIFTQGLLGIYHGPTWAVEKENFPCVRLDNKNFRRIGILGDQDLRSLRIPGDACPKAEAPAHEILFHAGKFTLLTASFQRPDEYEAATWPGRVLSFAYRLFFPIQLGLLFVAIKRRFRR